MAAQQPDRHLDFASATSTVAVIADNTYDEAVARIENGLRLDEHWVVTSLEVGDITSDEGLLAQRLAGSM